MLEFDLIMNKELTADDEENNDTRNDVGERLIKSEVGRNLTCTLLHKYKEERRKNHK